MIPSEGLGSITSVSVKRGLKKATPETFTYCWQNQVVS